MHRSWKLFQFITIFYCFNICFGNSFRASSIAIDPDYVITDPHSVHHFTCTNDGGNYSSLEISLTKNFSANEVAVSSTVINETTIDIRLEINDYFGTFHLLCYGKGARSSGIRSDVLVKATPSIIQLDEQCRVHYHRYLKCAFHAVAFARALKNDYPFYWGFEELNRSPAHRAYSNAKIIKEECTEELLVFKWTPIVDSDFPSGLRMKMNITLKFREPSIYYFDTTPIFAVLPEFNLSKNGHNSIQILMQKSTTPMFCQKSVSRTSDTLTNQTWSNFLKDQSDILRIDDLTSNTNYNVCVRCRQELNDPIGEKICKEIRTGHRFENILTGNTGLYILAAVSLICFTAFTTILFRAWNRSKKTYSEVRSGLTPMENHSERSETSSGSTKRTEGFRDSSSSVYSDQESSDETSSKDHQSKSYKELFRSSYSFLDYCDIPKL